MEDVAAGELPHMVPILKIGEADDAAMGVLSVAGMEAIGEDAVEIELLG